MPIKYNLTKHDMLADKIHDITIKQDSELTADDELLQAEATLIVSFSSAHSWQTFKIITNGANALNKPEIKTEYALAKTNKWKLVRTSDIQEVASMSIGDSAFYTWLNFNVDKNLHDRYKRAWEGLKQEFNEECDDISVKAD